MIYRGSIKFLSVEKGSEKKVKYRFEITVLKLYFVQFLWEKQQLKSREKGRHRRTKVALEIFGALFRKPITFKFLKDTSKMPSLKFQNLPTSWLGSQVFWRKIFFLFFLRPVAAARDDSRIFLKIEKSVGTFFRISQSFSFIACTVDAWG